MNIAPGIDTTLQPVDTIREALEHINQTRRRPLRGKALVDLAQKMGLPWADTGTGHESRTVYRCRDGRLYGVLPSGQFVRVVERARRFMRFVGRTLTKKQRNRLRKRLSHGS